MFIITTFIPLAFSTFEEKMIDYWNSLIVATQILTGICTTFNPKRSCMRFLMALFLVTSFWLDQIYSGFLISFNQRLLYKHQISTQDEIASNDDIRLAGDPFVFDYINEKKIVSKLFENSHFS